MNKKNKIFNKMGVSKLSDYKIMEEVGKGSFARVSKVKHIPTNKIYVWKELDYGRMSDKEKQMVVDEVNILHGLRHRNIVQYYDRLIDKAKRRIYIVQEHCDAGDLAMLIEQQRARKKKIPETFIWSVLSEISSALYACHKKEKGARVLHRDLKPSNIFLSSLNNCPDKSLSELTGLSVKLGDFGLARVLHDQSVFAQSHVGTPYYMSPEQIQFENYDERSDIWSLGCILYELGTLQPPFKARRYAELARKIQKGHISDFGSMSNELTALISKMLNVNPAERPSIRQILQLPIVQLTLKTSKVEYMYLSAKKLEFAYRQKKRKMKELASALVKKKTKLEKWEQSLQQQKLEFERHQRLWERSLLSWARAKGLRIPVDLKCKHTPDRSYQIELNDMEHPLQVFGSMECNSPGFEEALSVGFFDQNSSRGSFGECCSSSMPEFIGSNSFQCSTDELLEILSDTWH